MQNTKKETSMRIAYDRILHKIINERLKPGTPLREDHLAKEFGLSSTPVREAFRRLEHEGWIESFPYKGSFLKRFTAEEIKDLYLLREAIELVAIGLAVKNATKKDWERIEKALQMEKKYINDIDTASAKTDDDHTPPLSSDIDFHNAIVCASHSELLLNRNDTLRAQFNCMFLSVRIKSSMEQLIETYDEHLMIYRAMRRGWVTVAEDLIRKHVSEARVRYLSKADFS